jgi:hypothetical protein
MAGNRLLHRSDLLLDYCNSIERSAAVTACIILALPGFKTFLKFYKSIREKK